MKRWSVLLSAVVGLMVLVFALSTPYSERSATPPGRKSLPVGNESAVQRFTVNDRLAHYAQQVETRLRPAFLRRGLVYPPTEIALLGFKQERRVELWSRRDSPGAPWQKIKTYPFTAFSGALGPKLREGDLQIPEGIYQVSALNPNSSYHLSLKINYPNAFDLHYAQQEGRKFPGTNIFLHGRDKSVGCIALGDPAIEELFVLVASVGKDRVKVIIAPYDFRGAAAGKKAQAKKALAAPGVVRPAWLPVLYNEIRQALSPFQVAADKPAATTR